MTKLKIIFFVLSIITFSCGNNIGIDGPEVMDASEALKKISATFFIKRQYCFSSKLTSPSLNSNVFNNGLPGIGSCNDKNNFKGSFFWTKSVNYCIQVIATSSCPTSDDYSNFLDALTLSRCDLRSVYWINSKKPFQGKLLWFPGGPKISMGCL